MCMSGYEEFQPFTEAKEGEANLEYEIIFTSHCQGGRMMNLVCLCNDMRMSSLYVINGGSGP